jgi:hypothetical protein
MNGDIHAARKLLSELREAYQSLPGQLRLRISRLLREGTLPGDSESRTVRPDSSRDGPVVSIL